MKILILLLCFMFGCTPQSGSYSSLPFLEKFEGDDLRMLGQFEGTLQRKDGKEDTVHITLTPDGYNLVSLSDSEGKIYANNSGSRMIKKADDQYGYYIEVSSDSYLQISLKHYPQLSGKYVEKDEVVGKVFLRKLDQ